MDLLPPLKLLHSDSTLNKAKLAELGRLETEVMKKTLLPGEKHSLKARPDETILDGHHRIEILRNRGIDVDSLPREVISKITEDDRGFRKDEKNEAHAVLVRRPVEGTAGHFGKAARK